MVKIEIKDFWAVSLIKLKESVCGRASDRAGLVYRVLSRPELYIETLPKSGLKSYSRKGACVRAYFILEKRSCSVVRDQGRPHDTDSLSALWASYNVD